VPNEGVWKSIGRSYANILNLSIVSESLGLIAGVDGLETRKNVKISLK